MARSASLQNTLEVITALEPKSRVENTYNGASLALGNRNEVLIQLALSTIVTNGTVRMKIEKSVDGGANFTDLLEDDGSTIFRTAALELADGEHEAYHYLHIDARNLRETGSVTHIRAVVVVANQTAVFGVEYIIDPRERPSTTFVTGSLGAAQ